MMKKYLVFLLLVFLFIPIGAQDKVNDYVFSDKIVVKHTSVKDQNRTGTCWSYATTSFIEAEILRLSGHELDLSEMYFVNNAYKHKADLYVRFHGTNNFSQGGQAHDVLMQIEKLGFVPENDFKGLNYGEENHVHSELATVLKSILDATIKNRNRTLSTAWKGTFNSALKQYLGEIPKEVKYKGETFTPAAFAKMTKFDPKDYVEITSYNHHPFYKPFILELPDNWTRDQYYNLPMDELMELMYYAIENGYSVCWDGDVGEKGFSHNNCVAILPETKISNLADSEMLKWSDMSASDRVKQMYSFRAPVPEIKVTQELRQETFDRYSTTDDHLMHFVGMAKDQNGTPYFLVKNSWAESNQLGGYLYMSDAYARLKTVAIMVHKKAIPKHIAKKLEL